MLIRTQTRKIGFACQISECAHNSDSHRILLTGWILTDSIGLIHLSISSCPIYNRHIASRTSRTKICSFRVTTRCRYLFAMLMSSRRIIYVRLSRYSLCLLWKRSFGLPEFLQPYFHHWRKSICTFHDTLRGFRELASSVDLRHLKCNVHIH
jgi:hypothetical protein